MSNTCHSKKLPTIVFSNFSHSNGHFPEGQGHIHSAYSVENRRNVRVRKSNVAWYPHTAYN